MTKPVRVVRSRVRGSKLTSPNGLPVVVVDRTTKWGNPYPSPPRPLTDAERAVVVSEYKAALELGSLDVSVADVKRELRAKNLACWCKLDQLCHADVLLEIANA